MAHQHAEKVSRLVGICEQVEVLEDEFTDRNVGRLVAHGRAPYENDVTNRPSYYVTLETIGGKEHTTWGVDLERAMSEAKPEIGDTIGLRPTGSETVRLPDGQMVERNAWTIHRGDDLAFRQLEERLSRTGLKETTLDYVRGFAARRGIAEQFGVRSEIELPDENEGPRQSSFDIDRSAPLLPAITRYDRSIEDVAREKAMSTFDRAWEAIEAVAKQTFIDADAVLDRLRSAIIDQNADGRVLAKALGSEPERFGNLLGKAGGFGDNKERKQARHYARSVAAHTESVAVTWQRRFGEELSAERWQREKRDVIEVPGLTPRSAEILAKVNQMALAERSGWINELWSTLEGRQALDEAKAIDAALRQRFGSADPRKFGAELERDGSLGSRVEAVKKISQTVDRVRRAELSRDHVLKRDISLKRGLDR
ncbi:MULTISPECIES: BID domain-containing protein [Rhizobium]|uniref:Bartonella effector protein BID domain-containing protein n=1 Tax=Rhizobium paranaense TaxID=1650438 RepID=A0A7W8XZ59_9HYPH|nr:BID domain-containing protein [Rhizobium paranaense]MBB5578040.1 hypothetical protein [Rhizobium paranaense]